MGNVIQLKRRIIRAIRSIQQETLQKMWKLRKSVNAKIREDGGHIEHL